MRKRKIGGRERERERDDLSRSVNVGQQTCYGLFESVVEVTFQSSFHFEMYQNNVFSL
jgi:hypothetical protein